MTDPLKDIEDRKTWMDFGRQAYLIYLGAREEGANLREAFIIVAAFYMGMFKGAKEDEDE